MSKHMDKWAQIHRPEGHPALAGHMDTMVVSHTTGHTALRDMWTQWLQGTDPGHGVQGQGKGAFWHDCTGIVRRGQWGLVWRHLGATPMQNPSGTQSVFHTLLSSFTTSS